MNNCQLRRRGEPGFAPRDDYTVEETTVADTKKKGITSDEASQRAGPTTGDEVWVHAALVYSQEGRRRTRKR